VGVAGPLLRSRAVAALASPHGIDRYLELVNPQWAAHEVRARVVRVDQETGGDQPVATVTLQPTSTWRGHRGGQYVQVGVEVDGARRTTRCFSVSSAASGPGEPFTITVRSQDDRPGRPSVSRFLATRATPGTTVHLSQAEGDFTLPGSPATPLGAQRLLMISGGSGITPLMSQLRTLLRDGYDGHAGRRVTFLHYARTAADQIFADELRFVARADNGVDVHLVHDRAGGEPFSAAALARLVPDFRDVDTWVCGPAGLVELVKDAYGVSTGPTDESRLHVEYFKPASVDVPSGAAEGDVAFARSGTSAPNSGETLLAQAEALGLRPESGCRMGICFSCTSRKTAGTVRNVLTGAESAAPDEDIQICVSQPVGDCVVDL
jgi:ferredoxin-NADP reductase